MPALFPGPSSVRAVVRAGVIVLTWLGAGDVDMGVAGSSYATADVGAVVAIFMRFLLASAIARY